MKKISILSIALALCLFLCCACGGSSPAPAPAEPTEAPAEPAPEKEYFPQDNLGYALGMTMPDFSFTTFDGREMSLYASLAEKELVVINLWATWCGPCGMEFPYMENPCNVTEMRIGLVRSGWGYTSLKVTCEGDFVFAEKEFLTDDDFLGNICRLPVYIDSSQCRMGKNFGKVMLSNSRCCLEIPVTVRLGEQEAGEHPNMARKQMIAKLMNGYRDFRLKKLGTSLWLKESESCVAQLVAMDENDIEARLFQAQLLITREQLHEAGWILEHTGELLEQQKLPGKWSWSIASAARNGGWPGCFCICLLSMTNRTIPSGIFWKTVPAGLYQSHHVHRGAAAFKQ